MCAENAMTFNLLLIYKTDNVFSKINALLVYWINE